MIWVRRRFFSILDCCPKPQTFPSFYDVSHISPPLWDPGEATLTILVCSAENLEDKRVQIGAVSRAWEARNPHPTQQGLSWPGCPLPCLSFCPACSQTPAQLSSAGAFPTREAQEEYTAGPTACSLLLWGLDSWGGAPSQLPAPSPIPRVHSKFFLMHQPLAQS